MLEFNNQIHIARICDVESFNNGIVLFKNGMTWIKLNARSEVKPTDKIKNTSAGSYYNQKLKAYIEKLPVKDKCLIGQNMPCLVKLYHEQGEVLWGSITIPCRINLSPGIQSEVLEITRKGLNPFL